MSGSLNEWSAVRLGELFKIKHGFAFKGAHFTDESGAIVLTPGNFNPTGGLKLRPGKDRSYSGPFPSEFILQADDLLVVMTDLTQEAAILGSPAVVPAGTACLHNQRLGKVFDLAEDRIHRGFLYHLFNSPGYREHLKSTATGATVRHTSPSRIYDYVVKLPPLKTQSRIASILGAYDDLIEVNRRRVAVLEEMARGLFEEWFVRFRFPGHEAAEIVETGKGPLPSAWTWATLADLGQLKSGNNKLTKAAYRSEGVRAYSASGPDGFVHHAAHEGPAVIVSAVGAYCGRTWLAGGRWTTIANTFAVIPHSEVPAEFLYLGTLGIDKWPRRGAAQPFIAKADAGAMVLPKPPSHLWSRFASLANPILAFGGNCAAANARLAASRDLLLPRLISGQLSVDAAERELEEAA